MKGLDVKNLCPQGGDMLAYLYNEISAADRETFEVHLADCGTCIDDFAELSQSRYPVYEWKRTQFDPLPTPRVAIPLEPTAAFSLFDKIRAAFALRPTLALGGLGAAMLVAVIAGYAIFLGAPGETEVAREIEPTSTPESVVALTPLPPVTEDRQKNTDPAREERQITAKVATAPKSTVRSPNPKAQPARLPKRNDLIPVMSSLEDDEDDSLRLADIFDEIGASE